MIEAFLLGAAAQSSLILSGLFVYVRTLSPRVVGAIAAFGAGAIIGAITTDLLPRASALGPPEIALWLLIGAGIFVASDRIVERRFGADGAGGPLGIVIGAVVDGIPESIIFGIQLVAGDGISPAFLAAVWISNVPQAIVPSAELRTQGWRPVRMVVLWSVVVLACAVAAAAGFGAGAAAGGIPSRAASLAAGGLLAMLTDSLVPFAFERDGSTAGIWTVVGLAFALGLG